MVKNSALKLLLVIFLAISSSFAISQSRSGEYINEYSRYNADRTLRLKYIEQNEDYTYVFIEYLGTTNVGNFTGLYLNNFRIIDRDTDDEYKPTDTGLLPTREDSKFYVYNSGESMMLRMTFDRLPSKVRHIDLLESDGGANSNYNFTFRNIYLEPANDITDDLGWDYFLMDSPYLQTFYTYDNLTIEINIDGKYVGKIDRKFNDREYQPDCAEYGTFTVAFAEPGTHSLSASGSIGNKKYSWNFSLDPKSGMNFDECKKTNMKIN